MTFIIEMAYTHGVLVIRCHLTLSQCLAMSRIIFFYNLVTGQGLTNAGDQSHPLLAGAPIKTRAKPHMDWPHSEIDST